MKKLFYIFILAVYLFFGHTAFAFHGNIYPPVEYIENQGQWEAPFLFKGSATKGDIYLQKNGFRIVLADAANHAKTEMVHHGQTSEVQTLNFHAYDIQFLNSNPTFTVKKTKEQTHYYNYFLGNKPENWKSSIHPCLAVDYENFYNNIDMHVYSDAGNVKYDMIVHPGGDLNGIKINYNGVSGLRIDNNKLLIKTSLGESVELAPYSYQFIEGEKVEVKCKYKLRDNIVSFDVANTYNKAYDLYIDPTLIFCTFTGSTADNWGFTATNDTSGNFYAGGITSGLGYPVTVGVVQVLYGGGTAISGSLYPCDASFSKFNTTGDTLKFATYLGGADNDQPHSIIVDKNGNLCIAGRTYSTNFPTTTGCYDATPNGGADMFITKMNSTGTALIGSTYIGGAGDDGVNEEANEFLAGVLKHNYADDARTEIIYDANNNVYVASCTKSTNFPTAGTQIQAGAAGQQDGVILQLNNNLTSLIWSTYVGGSANDAAYVLSLNKSNPNELFVAGGTISSNFPSTAGSFNPTYQGGPADGFLLKINTSTKALMASTFIGTNAYDQVYGVQTDDSSHVYIEGQTLGAYPVSAGVYNNPGSSQFIAKFNNTLTTQMLSTVYGSGTTVFNNISPNAFLVDKCQNIYVSGWGGTIGFPNSGSTLNMPTLNPLQGTTDGNDFYFIVLSKNMQNLVYASYFGQVGGTSEHVDGGTSRFDENGVIYQAICAACGGSQIFPTSIDAYATQNGSTNCNLAALKISFDLLDPYAVASATGPLSGCVPLTVTLINNSTSATNYYWDFGDGSAISTASVPPPHTYSNPGNYLITFVAYNPNGCTANSDTLHLSVTVKGDSIFPAFTVVKKDSCGPFTANFFNTSSTNFGPVGPNATYLWDFGDGTSFSGANPPLHSFPTATNYVVTLTMTDVNACNNPAIYTANVNFAANFVKSEFKIPDSVCAPALVAFIDQSTNGINFNWRFGDGNSSNVPSPNNMYTTPGLYTVVQVVGNPNTCNLFDSTQKTIFVAPSPNADFSWTPNPPEPNKPNEFKNLSTGATLYLWNFGDGTTSAETNVTHIYEKDGTYNVCLTASNIYGCRDTACKSVRGIVVPLVDVPTGFSPNGDGVNDIVYVKGYGIETMTFRIFNRWGQKIFESNNKNVGWDGRYKSVIQEMDVYGYTLSVSFFDGTKTFKKGNITLLK